MVRRSTRFFFSKINKYCCFLSSANTQEEMKRVNSPFRMLHSIRAGTKQPLNREPAALFQLSKAYFPHCRHALNTTAAPTCYHLPRTVNKQKKKRASFNADTQQSPLLLQSPSDTSRILDAKLLFFFSSDASAGAFYAGSR